MRLVPRGLSRQMAWRQWWTALVAAPVAWLGVVLPWWGEALGVPDTLREDIHGLQVRLAQGVPLAPPPQSEAMPPWPSQHDAATVWVQLQQGAQQQGLQVQSLRPQALTLVAELPEQAVVLGLQGRWDEWLQWLQSMAPNTPWWLIERWQIAPLFAVSGPADALHIELHARLGLQPLPVATDLAHGQWASEPVVPTLPRVTLPGAIPSTRLANPASTVSASSSQAWTADPGRWPAQQWQLLGIWQSGQQPAHAVLGHDSEVAVVKAGQIVGQEAHRVERIEPSALVLRPISQGVTWRLALKDRP